MIMFNLFSVFNFFYLDCKAPYKLELLDRAL